MSHAEPEALWEQALDEPAPGSAFTKAEWSIIQQCLKACEANLRARAARPGVSEPHRQQLLTAAQRRFDLTGRVIAARKAAAGGASSSPPGKGKGTP